ncbi:MAG: hypothetical protein U9O89_00285, partial [Thermoproteota archaeon]|nr:hypothetical protein [Thermoproteota archaeon]
MSEDRYRGKSLVFGNLLDLHNIEIKAKLEIAAKLLEELKLLERGVFTAFISFVLAEAGYYNKTFAELNPPHEKEKTPFTTEFDDEDWGSEVDQLYVSEEFRRDMSDVENESLKKSQEWTIRYIGNKNNQVDVKFLSGDPFW